MEMDRPPARMQICLSPGRETENLFGVALKPATNLGMELLVTFQKVSFERRFKFRAPNHPVQKSPHIFSSVLLSS